MAEPERLRLRIDSLVLEGLSRESTEPLLRALRERLAELLRSGIPQGLESTSYVDGGAVQVEPGESPTSIGSRIASAVYTSLNSEAKR